MSYKALCEDMSVNIKEIGIPDTKEDIDALEKRIKLEFAQDIQECVSNRGVVHEDHVQNINEGYTFSDYEDAMINLNTGRAKFGLPYIFNDWSVDQDNDLEDEY